MLIEKRRFKHVWADVAGPRYEAGPAATIAKSQKKHALEVMSTGLRPLCRKKQTIQQFERPDLYGARTARWYRPSISSHRRPDSAA